MLKISANAKVNLFLEITGKLQNGYHTVDTVMQSVSLSDTIELELITKQEGIRITCDDSVIPVDEHNIAYKTARSFLDHTGVECGVAININKRIPAEAGMGGGSADGAAVLVALNKLCGDLLDHDALELLAAQYGADIPFCINGGTKRLTGIGTETAGIYNSPELPLVIVKPDVGISTPSAYSCLDGKFNNFVDHCARSPIDLINAIDGRSKVFPELLFNRFEQILPDLCPISKKIIEFLTVNSHGSLLCGSGTAVFAIADSNAHALVLTEKVKKEFSSCSVWTATTSSCGCLIL